MKDITKSTKSMETKLSRITERAKNQQATFDWLMALFNKENLYECFLELSPKKAIGVDGITKDKYGQNVMKNLESLIASMKRMVYRPKAVREVLIPKEGSQGKYRPLGISSFEDKIVQLMASKILEAIYEPLFLNSSYGFRPNRNCHTAIKAVSDYLYRKWYTVIIDVDLKNFFGTLNHKVILDFLRIRIKDERFIRYIARMLKAGILRNDELTVTEEGSPQGNIVSPVLANIYAHYVIDEWFENVVKSHVYGNVEIFRYCDDIVICCEYDSDARKIRKALEGRLKRFNLELNNEKTKTVRMDKRDGASAERQETFDFLGFTFYLGRSHNGRMIPKVKTSKKRIRNKLQKVKTWCKRYRCTMNLTSLWEKFRLKIIGHMQYYSVSYNTYTVRCFVKTAIKIFFKWINRRSQRSSINWDKFNLFMRINPIPNVKVSFSLF